jgi:hypothetical protein
MEILSASFIRLGYSGKERFAEVEVAVQGEAVPLMVTFGKDPEGGLTLVNVAEKREDWSLDWFNNDLHEAYVSVTEERFGTGEGADEARSAFAEQVLSCGNVRETIEDVFFDEDP